MLRCLPLVLLALALPAGGSAAARNAPVPADTSASVRILSFNIRYNNPADGPDAWPHRIAAVARLMRSADLIGVQEALPGQLADLEDRLEGFDWIGVGRADGEEEGEFSAIFYRTDRFALLDRDTFWLYETPDVRGSVGWDAAMERIVTWGKFRDRRTGRVFFHFNTHFDHRGERARRESARLLVRKIGAIAGAAPVLVTGDFNATDTSATYRILTEALRDARAVSATPPTGPNSTWNGFEKIAPGRRIDYIFVRGPVRVLGHAILAERRPNGRFPSDHLPVRAEVVLEE